MERRHLDAPFCFSESVLKFYFKFRDLFRPSRMVVIAQYSRDFPCAILVPPEMDEATFAGPVCCFCFLVEKAVNAHFDRPVALHVVDLQRAGHQDALGVAGANVVLMLSVSLSPPKVRPP